MRTQCPGELHCRAMMLSEISQGKDIEGWNSPEFIYTFYLQVGL